MMIFLIGMSRAGKTETGKILANKLKVSFIDTDSFMEELYGKTIRELYKTNEEKNFRLKELECFDKIIEKLPSCSNDKNAVVSTGGGYAENEVLVKKLKDFPRIILIDTDPAEIFHRIKTAEYKDGFYPAFLGENIKYEEDAEKSFFEIYERRIKIYRSLASFSINPKGFSPENTAEQIILSL